MKANNISLTLKHKLDFAGCLAHFGKSIKFCILLL